MSVWRSKKELLKETMRLLTQYGIRASRRLSQHFMIDPKAIERMVSAADLGDEDHVVEIGAGTGNLSIALVNRAGRITLIEKDAKLVKLLRDRFSGLPNVKVICADALNFRFPNGCKIVSNVPYHISSKLLLHILDQANYQLAVLTLQKEFGERIIASVGTKKYGRITLHVQLKAHAEKVMDVSRNSFWPPPKVDSVTVMLKPKHIDLSECEEEVFLLLTNLLFRYRNKKLINALRLSKTYFTERKMDVNDVIEVFERTNMLNMRPFELSLNALLLVSRALCQLY